MRLPVEMNSFEPVDALAVVFHLLVVSPQFLLYPRERDANREVRAEHSPDERQYELKPRLIILIIHFTLAGGFYIIITTDMSCVVTSSRIFEIAPVRFASTVAFTKSLT